MAASENCGKPTATTKPLTSPTMRAATTTPQNDPSPPITTTTNAAVMISLPIAG
jgi:hypothetical protein